MAGFYFYFSSCVLLLTLSWRTSTGLPVRTQISAEKLGDCSLGFKNLLLNITEILRNRTDVLCYGIPRDNEVMSGQADTVLACAPAVAQNSGCVMKKESFSESECLRNITKDLAYYAAAIESYLQFPLRTSGEEVPLLSPTLEIVKSLRKNCSLMPDGGNDSAEVDAAQMWSDDSFSNRKKMCEMMKGFHIRTITINRAIGYISSGDHSE